MRKSSLLIILFASALATGIAADTVETVDGEILTGTIERSSFVIETDDGRRLDVPKESLRVLYLEGGQVRLELLEGEPLRGRLVGD